MQLNDWTISEYEYETYAQKVQLRQVPQPIKTDLHNIFKIWTLTFFLYSGFLHKKADRHDITEILLKVALNTITLLKY